MPSWLSQAGWAKVGLEDYTEPYVIWYDSLLRAFELDQKWIVETFGEEWRRYVVDWYETLRTALAVGNLRGALFKATAAER